METTGASSDVAPPFGSFAEVARRYIKLRRKRERVWPNLFHDPSWDILIDLYAASDGDRRVSVTSACIASAAPTSTALRHIDRLIILGLIERQEDVEDRRRVYLSLTAKGLSLSEDFMIGLAELQFPPR